MPLAGNETSHVFNGATVLGGLSVLGGSTVNGVRVATDGSVTPQDFGAAGDGVTDDTVAIQRAIDSVSSTQGGKVFFPAGYYKLTNSISLTNRPGIVLEGVGASSYASSGQAYTVLRGSVLVGHTSSMKMLTMGSGTTLQQHGPTISGLTLCGNGSSATSVTGIEMKGVNHGALRDVGVFNCGGVGIYIDQETATDSAWWLLEQCRVAHCDINFHYDGFGAVFVGGYSTNPTTTGFNVEPTTQCLRMYGVKFDTHGAATGMLLKGGRNQLFGCMFEGQSSGSHVSVDGNGVTPSGQDNQFHGCSVVGTTGVGTGITLSANAARTVLLDVTLSNVATALSDSGSETTFVPARQQIGGANVDAYYPFLGFRLGGASGPRVVQGSNTPEGAITAPVGSLFLRTDGGVSTTLYVKTSGAGNTGWTAK